MYMAAPDPITENTVWISKLGTEMSYTFTGLEVGKRYWMKVVAMGTRGQNVPSEPILTRLVQ